MAARLSVVSTDAEQRWLSGDGEKPPSSAERLPPRAPVLLPRPGVRVRLFPAAEIRLVVEGGAVVLMRGGRERRIAGPGSVTRAVWMPPEVMPQSRDWPESAFGYVLLDGERPAVFKVDQWYPGKLDRPGADALRLTGFEALAQALGRPLEVADREGDVGLPSARKLVNPYRGVVHPLACTVTFVLGLVGLFVLALAGQEVAATVFAAGLFLLCALFDVFAVLQLRRWRDRWSASAERSWQHNGNLLLLRQGSVGQEVVLSDRAGWACWLPGPQLGGAASLIVAREAVEATPWGLLLLDRDDRYLAALPAEDWLAEPDAGRQLSAAVSAPDGLAVDTAVIPRWPEDRLTRPRVRGRPVQRQDDYLGGGRLGLWGMIVGAGAGQAGVAGGLIVFPIGIVLVLGLWGLRRWLR